jgi:hypothetical protein
MTKKAQDQTNPKPNFELVDTILDAFKLARNTELARNEATMNVYCYLRACLRSRKWQNERYYEGASGYLYLKDSSFQHFMNTVFRRSMTWYNRMEEIIALKNGEELFNKYGYGNMVTYLTSTSEQRSAILTEAEVSLTTVTFSSIRYRLFPQVSAEEDTEYITKKEHLKVVSDLKTKHAKEVADLKAKHAFALATMMDKFNKDMDVLRGAFSVLASTPVQQKGNGKNKEQRLNG